ncbi:MAG: SDR family oxidoreductase, partial [Isosphaeraceae bacterium]
MCKAAYPSLRDAGGGKVINIGSMASIFGSPYGSSYAASKGAVVQFTKSLALAWAKENIQVNAILPGWFETEMTDGAKREVPGLNERVLARVPVGRWGKPEEIAGTAVWLASRASDYVTGAAVPVDGGCSSAL